MATFRKLFGFWNKKQKSPGDKKGSWSKQKIRKARSLDTLDRDEDIHDIMNVLTAAEGETVRKKKQILHYQKHKIMAELETMENMGYGEDVLTDDTITNDEIDVDLEPVQQEFNPVIEIEAQSVRMRRENIAQLWTGLENQGFQNDAIDDVYNNSQISVDLNFTPGTSTTDPTRLASPRPGSLLSERLIDAPPPLPIRANRPSNKQNVSFSDLDLDETSSDSGYKEKSKKKKSKLKNKKKQRKNTDPEWEIVMDRQYIRRVCVSENDILNDASDSIETLDSSDEDVFSGQSRVSFATQGFKVTFHEEQEPYTQNAILAKEMHIVPPESSRSSVISNMSEVKFHTISNERNIEGRTNLNNWLTWVEAPQNPDGETSGVGRKMWNLVNVKNQRNSGDLSDVPPPLPPRGNTIGRLFKRKAPKEEDVTTVYPQKPQLMRSQSSHDILVTAEDMLLPPSDRKNAEIFSPSFRPSSPTHSVSISEHSFNLQNTDAIPSTSYNDPIPSTSYNDPIPLTSYNDPIPSTSYNDPIPSTSYGSPISPTSPNTTHDMHGIDEDIVLPSMYGAPISINYDDPIPSTSYGDPIPSTSYGGGDIRYGRPPFISYEDSTMSFSEESDIEEKSKSKPPPVAPKSVRPRTSSASNDSKPVFVTAPLKKLSATVDEATLPAPDYDQNDDTPESGYHTPEGGSDQSEPPPVLPERPVTFVSTVDRSLQQIQRQNQNGHNDSHNASQRSRVTSNDPYSTTLDHPMSPNRQESVYETFLEVNGQKNQQFPPPPPMAPNQMSPQSQLSQKLPPPPPPLTSMPSGVRPPPGTMPKPARNSQAVPSDVPPPPPSIATMPRGPRPTAVPPPPAPGSNTVPRPPGVPAPPPPPPPGSAPPPPGSLLAGISNMKLKKTDPQTQKPSDRPGKAPDSNPHGALIAQIQGGIKLRKSPGHKSADGSETSSVTSEESPLSSAGGANNLTSISEDQPPPPPPIDRIPKQTQGDLMEDYLETQQTQASTMENNAHNASMNGDLDVTQVPGYQPIPDGAPVWRKALLERKNKEAIEAFRKEIEEEQSEKAKWKNIPAWKKNLIETKEKKKVEGSEMDADERRRMEEENRRLQSMPTWKRNLVLKKRDG